MVSRSYWNGAQAHSHPGNLVSLSAGLTIFRVKKNSSLENIILAGIHTVLRWLLANIRDS